MGPRFQGSPGGCQVPLLPWRPKSRPHLDRQRSKSRPMRPKSPRNPDRETLLQSCEILGRDAIAGDRIHERSLLPVKNPRDSPPVQTLLRIRPLYRHPPKGRYSIAPRRFDCKRAGIRHCPRRRVRRYWPKSFVVSLPSPQSKSDRANLSQLFSIHIDKLIQAKQHLAKINQPLLAGLRAITRDKRRHPLPFAVGRPTP